MLDDSNNPAGVEGKPPHRSCLRCDRLLPSIGGGRESPVKPLKFVVWSDYL